MFSSCSVFLISSSVISYLRVRLSDIVANYSANLAADYRRDAKPESALAGVIVENAFSKDFKAPESEPLANRL